MKRTTLVVLVVLVLGFISNARAKSAPDTDQLLTQLELQLKSTPNVAPSAATAIRAALAQQRFAEALQYVANLANTARDNPQFVAITTQLTAAIQAQNLKTIQNREAIADKVVADATALFFKHEPAAAYDDLLVQLAKIGAVRDYQDPSSQKVELARQFVVKCQDYTAAKSQGNNEGANNVLRELIEISTRVPNVPRSHLLALQGDAPKPQEDPTYLALSAKLSALLDTAKGPEDFDPLIKELAQTYSPDRYTQNQRKIEGLRRIAKKWQDYFAAVTANEDNAGRILNELLNDTEADSLYPRSKVLRLSRGQSSATLTKPEELNLKTLDAFCVQLRAIPSNSTITETKTSVDSLRNEANALKQLQAQIQAGNLPPAASLASRSRYSCGEYTAAFDAIQQSLLRDAITQTLKVPDVTPNEAETLQAYLDRLLVYARDHKDWPLAQRVLDAESYVPSEFRNSVDTQCYTSFFAAQNLEKATDWVNAIRYYRAAARTTSQRAPIEEVAERLRALKEAHPQEYADADKAPAVEFAYPQRPGNFPAGAGYPPGYPTSRRP